MQAPGLSLDEWLTLLESYSPAEIDLGLERVELMLQRMQLPLPTQVLHVAGTNGKGSSAALLESILRQTGKTIGCYTSPHIVRYNERIRVAGEEASDAEIIAAFERIDALREEVPLTYFEFGTLAALSVFAAAGVEIAVLEIGLGGRLDAVNAVEPMASLITNVSLDHCAWLGNDVETIAAEKAGVMRTSKPVVFASRAMPDAIVDCAATTGATLYAAGRDYDWQVESDKWSWQGMNHALHGLVRPALQGEFQIQNAAGVLGLLAAADYVDLLDAAIVNAALHELRLPGRTQTIGGNWLLDVAHNPAAAEALATVLATREVTGKTIGILGMLDDKDVQGVVRALAPHVDGWVAVTAESPRAIPAAELARRVANDIDGPCLIADSARDAVRIARELTDSDDLVLATGSFYVVSGILAALGQHDG